MGRSKFTPNEKVEIIQAFQTGDVPYSMLREMYGMEPSEIYKWIKRYEEHGMAAFARGSGNASYTQAFKMMCVEEYLRGEGSLPQIVAKYNISSTYVLRNWIKRYNANIELKDYDPKREIYMAEAKRKTTLEERKEIVEYCIAHEKDYKGTASLYNVSYSQVYKWVKKYLAKGTEGLAQKRGRRKKAGKADKMEHL